MFECNLLLLLDRFLEGADSFSIRNLDREDMAEVVALDQTVEFEYAIDGCRGMSGKGI